MDKTTQSFRGNSDVQNSDHTYSTPVEYHSNTELHLSTSQKLLSMSKYMVKQMESLSAMEKQQLEKLETTNFSDFDASNDMHRKYINFLVEKMKSYKEYTAKHLNTADTTNEEKYKTMLSSYCDILNIPRNIFKLK